MIYRAKRARITHTVGAYQHQGLKISTQLQTTAELIRVRATLCIDVRHILVTDVTPSPRHAADTNIRVATFMSLYAFSGECSSL